MYMLCYLMSHTVWVSLVIFLPSSAGLSKGWVRDFFRERRELERTNDSNIPPIDVHFKMNKLKQKQDNFAQSFGARRSNPELLPPIHTYSPSSLAVRQNVIGGFTSPDSVPSTSRRFAIRSPKFDFRNSDNGDDDVLLPSSSLALAQDTNRQTMLRYQQDRLVQLPIGGASSKYATGGGDSSLGDVLSGNSLHTNGNRAATLKQHTSPRGTSVL